MTSAPKRSHEILFEEFHRLQADRHSLSLRAFAKKLGIPAGRVSQYFSGQRTISLKAAQQIVARMEFQLYDKNQFLEIVSAEKSERRAGPAATNGFHSLTEEETALVSDWHFFAILNLLDVKDFVSDPAWIARRLGLGVAQTSEAIAVLTKLGLAHEVKGRLQRTKRKLANAHGLSGELVKAWHEKILRRTIEALHAEGNLPREISSLTLAVDARRVPEAIKRMNAFRQRLGRFLEAGDRREVYYLNMQLLPLTQNR